MLRFLRKLHGWSLWFALTCTLRPWKEFLTRTIPITLFRYPPSPSVNFPSYLGLGTTHVSGTLGAFLSFQPYNGLKTTSPSFFSQSVLPVLLFYSISFAREDWRSTKLIMVKCKCGAVGIIRTAGTKRNPGRPFYACPLQVLSYQFFW